MYEIYFEIPIYSCTQEQFVKRAVSDATKVVTDARCIDEDSRREFLDDAIRERLFPIKHNELVGYIHVYAFSSQLRCDYSFTDKKRIRIGSSSRGIIKPVGKLLEKHYRRSSLTSAEIFNEFRALLERRVRSHSRLKRRFVDYSVFDRCGPYIDWRGILNI